MRHYYARNGIAAVHNAETYMCVFSKTGNFVLLAWRGPSKTKFVGCWCGLVNRTERHCTQRKKTYRKKAIIFFSLLQNRHSEPNNTW